MGYQVLARKWRPRKFSDVVGQSHVLTALANALDQDRLHHAYLFSGTRGVGKTTIARIFAKGLNCEQGVSATPCEVCSSCVEIDQGRFVDLLEIDAASRTKVEDTRELLDNVQYQPTRGRYKVYLIDEVHMLSRHSFNALLKTLEEPPSHVKFILATTDPQKLPITILSRCLQFHLKHLTASQIKDQLAFILEKETIAFQTRALSQIAQAAEGSMRDALSLTDQAIALGNGSVDDTNVSTMLGTLNDDQSLLLLEALQEGQATPLLQCLSVLADIGIEWDVLLKELSSLLHKIAMAQAVAQTVDNTTSQGQRILDLAQGFSAQDIQLFYQIVLQGRQDLPYAPDGRAGLEMVLLRMLAFKPVTHLAYEPSAIEVPDAPSATSLNKSTAQQRISQLKAQVATQSALAPSSEIKKVQVEAPAADTSVKAPLPSAKNEQKAVISDKSIADFVDSSSNSANEITPSFLPDVSDFTSEQDINIDEDDILAWQEQQMHDAAHLLPVNENESAPLPQMEKVEPKTSAPSSNGNVSTTNGIMAARNILRSRQRQQQEGSPPKKDNSVLVNTRMPSDLENKVGKAFILKEPMPNVEEQPRQEQPRQEQQQQQQEYRWQAMQATSLTEQAMITPERMKTALMHERSDQMRQQLEQEANLQDEWSKIACSLTLAPRIKQIALNASMVKTGQDIYLCLRASQAHLISEKSQALLASALKEQFSLSLFLPVEIGDKGITPLEWRDNIYAKKLTQARESLKNDPNVRFICQRFDAQVDEDSIRPL